MMKQDIFLTKRITRKQELAAQALAMGETATRAAVSAGISRETLYRWMKQPLFLDAIEDAGKSALVSHARILTGNLQKALDTLLEIMNDDTAPANARIRAAEVWLNQERSYRELETIEQRLSKLESRVNPENDEDI